MNPTSEVTVEDSGRWQLGEAFRQSKEAAERVGTLEQLVDSHITVTKTQMSHIEDWLQDQKNDLKMLVGAELRRTERELMSAKFDAFSRWLIPMCLNAIPILIGVLWWFFGHVK